MKKITIPIDVELPDGVNLVESKDGWVTWVEPIKGKKSVFKVVTLEAKNIFCLNAPQTIQLRRSEIEKLFEVVNEIKH